MNKEQDDLELEFRQKGFLSDVMSDVMRGVRQENKDWFNLAESLSGCLQSIAMRAVDTVRGKSLAPKVLATLLLLRSNSMMQAAILLIERGMAVEAKIMIRGILENTFCVAALHEKSDEFIKLFQDDDAASRRAQIKFILEHGLIGQDSERNKRLESLLSEIEKGQKNLLISHLSGLGVLKDQYLMYRVLSNDSAHPSATSLLRHMVVAEDRSNWVGYSFSVAEDNEITEVLDYLLLAAIPLGVGVTQVIEDKVGNAELGKLTDKLETIKKQSVEKRSVA